MNACCTRFAVAWLVSVLVACSSASIRYYILIPPPAGESERAAEATLAVEVRVVHLPPQLNRTELMVRTAPTETTLLDNERWASPVKDEIKEALRLELKRRLNGTTGLPPSFTKLLIDIDVQRLEAELGRYALLEASWTASLTAADPLPRGARVTICTFRADEKIHGGYAGIVEGYQRDIAALADAIVAGLRSSSSGVDAACQTSPAGSADGSGSKGR